MGYGFQTLRKNMMNVVWNNKILKYAMLLFVFSQFCSLLQASSMLRASIAPQ